MRSVKPARAAPADPLTSHRARPLSGTAPIPGDKSISHRALILGSLAEGRTSITGLLEGSDVLCTARAVEGVGAHVRHISPGRWEVFGQGLKTPTQPIDCGNSGTAARLLIGAVAGHPIAVTFTGDQSLSRRPMKRVLEPLRLMGAQAVGSELPVTIEGGSLQGISYDNHRSSAQVKSAILLAGLGAAGPVEVIEALPSRDHSENMLEAFGCELERSRSGVRLGPQRKLRGTTVAVPSDPSSAAFPMVAALLVAGSEILLPSILINPLRTGLIQTLSEMGAKIEISNKRLSGGETLADLWVRSSSLTAVEVPATRAPSMIDEYPILAIAASFAEGRTVMHGLAELRVKESDRIRSVVDGLQACGIEAREEGDCLVVEGKQSVRGGATIASNHDHRIAMSFLVLGMASAEPVAVDDAEMIETSFPGFAALMNKLGGDIR